MLRRTLRVLATLLVAAACADDPGVAARRNGSLLCGSTPLRLAVGETAVPATEGQMDCRVAEIAGAEYVLAWMDPRAIDGARSGAEPSFEPYPIGITIGPAGAELRDLPRGREPASRVRDSLPSLAADDVILQVRPRHRRTLWTLGERFQLEDDLSGLARPARIVRDYDGHTVVAQWEDEVLPEDQRFLAQLDTAMSIIRSRLDALWRYTFVDAPLRSSQAGQYLVLLQRGELTQARALAEVSGDTLYTWLQLYPFPLTSAWRLAVLVGHEMTHHYQMLHMHGSRSGPGIETRAAASFWAYEGGANLLTYEMLRRTSGISLDANHEWRAPAGHAALLLYQQRAQPANGVLTDGYDSAMGFLRDLMLRRMAAGETADAALRDISRGAIEGWYGFDGVTQRLGLVARMERALGRTWDPVEATLDWALAHAGDDLTANPRYQDRNSLRVWDLPAGQQYGWWPDASLSAAAPTQFVFKRYGSPGYARIREPLGDFSVEVEAFGLPLRWRLLRVR